MTKTLTLDAVELVVPQSYNAQLHFSTVAFIEQPFEIPFKVYTITGMGISEVS